MNPRSGAAQSQRCKAKSTQLIPKIIISFLSSKGLTAESDSEQGNHTVIGCLQFHKDNLRHLSRFPDFFVTFRILSFYSGFNTNDKP